MGHREHFDYGMASGGHYEDPHIAANPDIMERGATDSSYAMKQQGKDPSSIHFGYGAKKSKGPTVGGAVMKVAGKIPSKKERAAKKAAKRGKA